MAANAPVSLVLSVLNEGDRLRQTIDSALSAELLPAEIVVVDDGSTDGCADRLERAEDGIPPVRVFHRPHEGIAGARTYGASVATEQMLVFLDAHCCADSNWLEPLVELIGRYPDAIAVPTVANTARPPDRGCGARLINDVMSYQWITSNPPPIKVGIAPGGCFAIRSKLLRDLGGFACMRDFGVEDVELSLRAWRFGCPVRTVPQSCVRHDFRRTSPYRMRAENWLANVLLTALLHFSPDRLARTLRSAAGFASFAPAITSVLASDWLDRKAWIDTHSRRSLEGYWEVF